MKTFIYLLVPIIVCVFYASCSNEDTENIMISERVVIVDSKQEIGFDPIHNKERPFLRIKYKENLQDEWLTISGISGFDYEEGYIYELKVLEKIIKPSELKEDQYPVSYELINIISKEEDLNL